MISTMLSKNKYNSGAHQSEIFEPKFFDLNNETSAKELEVLLSTTPSIIIIDEIYSQLQELVKLKHPKIKFTAEQLEQKITEHLNGVKLDYYGYWIYYPWLNKLIHLLNEHEFVEVRTNRNQYKITPEEEELLSKKTIGIIGLSVGKAIALTIAMERICGELIIADFDVIELSNLNRIQTGVQNFNVKKTAVVAREIAEIDPYLKVTCLSEGLTEENLTEFFYPNGKKLDLCIEVCDGLSTKIFARQKAKEYKIPVVMNSSDRGTTDIERFDLDPDLPILHGLIDHLDLTLVKQAKTNEEKVPYLLPMLGLETSSTRLRASMLEIEQTITTWPQLASGVIIGGGICTDVCRRILLNQFHDSGRYFVDLEEIIRDVNTPKLADDKKLNIRNAITKNDMVKIAQSYDAKKYINEINLDEHTIKVLVESATKAPSGANIQSWKWLYYEKKLYLFLNLNYTAGLLDCKASTSFAGLGAAAENLVLQAHACGLEIISEELPMKEDSKLVAIFSFFDSVSKEIENLIEPHICDELVRAIPNRLTNRNIVKRQPIEREKLEEYKKIAQTISGADMIIIDNEELLNEIKEVTAKVDRMRIMHYGGHDDLIAEVRWNKEEVEKTMNGVDILGTVDLTPTELAGWKVCKNWNVVNHLNEWGLGTGLEKIQRKNIDSASAIGLITMPKFSQNDFYIGGRALERVWLAATRDNISVHPASLSTLIFNSLIYAEKNGFSDTMRSEAQELYKKFITLFGIDKDVGQILLFRFFKSGPPKEKSVRYPLNEVLYID
ncbi:MAG: Rv1355c family protein [Flavobacteriales bacterium]